jgi:uncharacterized protein YjbI with pentapeptide repeats
MKKLRRLILFNKRGKYFEKHAGYSQVSLKLSSMESIYTKPILFFVLIAIILGVVLLTIDLVFVNLNNENWQVNFLINLHASVIEVFILGIIVAWYNKQSNRIERIRVLQEELHSYRLLESDEAVYRKVGILKSLSELRATGIDLAGSYLKMEYGVYLDNIKLQKAILDGTRLSKAHLNKSDLSFANLHHAQLDGVQLQSANLEGAGLFFTNLIGANLYNVNLKNANIGPLMMDYTTSLNGVHLEGARVDGEDWIDRLKRIGVEGFEDIENRYHVINVEEKWYGNVQINHRIRTKK